MHHNHTCSSLKSCSNLLSSRHCLKRAEWLNQKSSKVLSVSSSWTSSLLKEERKKKKSCTSVLTITILAGEMVKYCKLQTFKLVIRTACTIYFNFINGCCYITHTRYSTCDTWIPQTFCTNNKYFMKKWYGKNQFQSKQYQPFHSSDISQSVGTYTIQFQLIFPA